MSSQSVLIVGASGYIGRVVAQEFLAQKSKFARVAILSAVSKVEKFVDIAKSGMEVVIGSFLEPSSFKGKHHHAPIFEQLLHLNTFQASPP